MSAAMRQGSGWTDSPSLLSQRPAATGTVMNLEALHLHVGGHKGIAAGRWQPWSWSRRLRRPHAGQQALPTVLSTLTARRKLTRLRCATHLPRFYMQVTLFLDTVPFVVGELKVQLTVSTVVPAGC